VEAIEAARFEAIKSIDRPRPIESVAASNHWIE
jgi:hypothetical protein